MAKIDGKIEFEISSERSDLSRRMNALGVESASKDELSEALHKGKELRRQEKNRLALELAELPDEDLERVISKSWEAYIDTNPQLIKYLEYTGGRGSNPLLEVPRHEYVAVIPQMHSIASVSIDNRALTQPVSVAEYQQLIITQLLTGDFRGTYPSSSSDSVENAESLYISWAHESGHTVLNNVYEQIIDISDRLEKELNPDFLTVGTNAGVYGSITAFQEAIVDNAASELAGVRVRSLPDVLFVRGAVTALPNFISQANRHLQEFSSVGDQEKGRDDIVMELWYESAIRKDVSDMCRVIVEARIAGINPYDLGIHVNEVIATVLGGNPGARHSDFKYRDITDIAKTLIRIGVVKPTMPPLNIKAEEVDVFKPQREQLVQLVAKNWQEVVGA